MLQKRVKIIILPYRKSNFLNGLKLNRTVVSSVCPETEHGDNQSRGDSGGLCELYKRCDFSFVSQTGLKSVRDHADLAYKTQILNYSLGLRENGDF